MFLGLKTESHKKGETILETLIAMGILAVCITMASTIMSTSIRNVNSSKNRVIAVNLAKEGLEAIRNIRDTNWLKFNSKKRECWNNDPKVEVCPNAITGVSSPIPAGDYIVYKEPLDQTPPIDNGEGWKWRLGNLRVATENPTPPSGLGAGDNGTYYNTTNGKSYAWNGKEWVDLTQLYIVDLDPLVDSDGDHDYTNDQDTYNHALVDENNALGMDFAYRTVLRRQISISYLDDNGTESNDPNKNRMLIRCKVTWQEGKNEFSTNLETHLTDYMGRENLN